MASTTPVPVVSFKPTWSMEGYQVAQAAHAVHVPGVPYNDPELIPWEAGGVCEVSDGEEFAALEYDDIKRRLRARLANKHTTKISLYFQKAMPGYRQHGSIIIRLDEGKIHSMDFSGYIIPDSRDPAEASRYDHITGDLTTGEIMTFTAWANMLLVA